MEEELKAFLIRSIKKPKNFIRYFPLNSGDIFNDQLTIISNKIKSYGNGYIQNKDFVYYYRTFNLQKSNKTIFCLIYFHFSLNRKYLEKLADEIYDVSDNNRLFQNNNIINENAILQINGLYYKYLSIIRSDKGIRNFCSGIDLVGHIQEDEKDNNKIDCATTQGVLHKSKKYSRIKEKITKTNSDLGNTFNNNPFSETEFTFLMRGYNLSKIIQIIKWKKFKKCWLIIFIILSILIYGLLGFYFYLDITSK